MITKERFLWLRQNKQRGDVMQVVRIMNPDNTVDGITYDEAAGIINGNLWGVWGQQFTDTLEQFINERTKRLEAESKKYSKKLTP